jgi:FtsZ-binding cell division protein ZapB
MSGYDTTNKLPAKAQNDTYFFLKELEKEIAALREENKAWEAMGSDLLETCDRLREENERLRKQSLIWHKWPAEKPVDKEFDVHGDFIWWKGIFLNGEWVNDDEPRYFAEIPRPEGDNDR